MSTPFTENDIRPDRLREEQSRRFARDVDWLLQQRQAFVQVPCPACDARCASPFFKKFTLDYVKCGQCGTVYINPRPPPEVLKEYYIRSENYAFWNQYIFPASETTRREKIFRPRAERLVEICRKHGLFGGGLLEVGAGFGTFGEEIQRLGFFSRYVGVEPTPDLANTCRNKGLEVLEKPVEEVVLDQWRPEVVAAFEVVEHLFDPAAFIRSCTELLAPGGLLILTCPNVFGFDILVLKEKSDAVDVEHLNYFHPESLSYLMNRCRLKVLESLTPGKLDAELVRKKVLAGEMDLNAQPFLHQVLMEKWEQIGEAFQHFLAAQGLSSHLWLVAQKTS